MSSELKHIELFAGCGGMSLGLDAAGFELYFANELSPMAGETFAYNLLNENLEDLATKKEIPNKTLWIKSNYSVADLKIRLRENPFETKNSKYSDLNPGQDLKNKLLIGDIDELLSWLQKNPKVINKIWKENITLVSGGPPCQSFSLAGKREKNNAKNLLPLSFAKFAGLVKPKFVILENVKGITAPFTENGKKYYAWFEVAKAFALEGFVPICMLLNSKYFGVAQNRPRFILLAIREDIAKKISKIYDEPYLAESLKFYKEVHLKLEKLEEIKVNQLSYYDIESNGELYNGRIFPQISTPKGEFISALEAIDDLSRTDIDKIDLDTKVKYRDKINTLFKSKLTSKKSDLKNHEPRSHTYNVKARFRLYQVVNFLSREERKQVIDGLFGKKLKKENLANITNKLSREEFYLKNGFSKAEYKTLKSPSEVESFLIAIATRKHSQRALLKEDPAPAQLTIPDDLCHYDKYQLRTLTVREMARFQSFPDWFSFRSKTTTGGENRKFEVPQYTQVGNAVPPLLAKALGESIVKILNEINEI